MAPDESGLANSGRAARASEDLPTSWSEERTRTFPVAVSSRDTHPAAPDSGDVLKARFVLQRQIAARSHSRIFAALDRGPPGAALAPGQERQVAIKLVSALPGRESRELQALRREAAIAQGLDHPHLPRILGLDQDGAHTFLVLDWLDGESLAQILDARGPRPMTRVQALRILEGVCRALKHLHTAGITHADVKPGNILVTTGGVARLLDFGVALGPGADDLPVVRGFTPEYASPEVLAGELPTPSDDLFSVACVAYRMLSGERPFGRFEAARARDAGLRPARIDSLSPQQWRALDRALSFTRADRQTDVGQFLAQLKASREDGANTTEVPALRDLELTVDDEPSSAWPSWWPIAAGGMALAVVAVLLLARPSPDAADEAPMNAPALVTGAPPPAIAAPAPIERTIERAPPVVTPEPATPLPETRPPSPAPVARVVAPRPTPVRERRQPALPPEVSTEPTPVAEAVGAEAPPVAPTAGAEAPAADPSVPFSSLELKRYVAPDYPRNAAARRIAGWVEVAFTVTPDGRTLDPRVVAAEPPGTFDAAALKAVRRWRFAAPTRNGTADTVQTRLRVRFDPE
jgi:TonB family protein